MRIHRVLAGVLTAMLPCLSPAQQDTLKEIERYRQLLQESNPAELYEARGEELWKTRRGPKNASLERCDLGLGPRSEEHTSELQSHSDLVCRLLLEKKNTEPLQSTRQ